MMTEIVFIVMLVVLIILSVVDLVVGVSNDAVNFLNSAIGSKVISLKNIMIIACLGILAGALFSSGMMEVARKGIFIPSEFYFNEIMIIFISVMMVDILLLDFFNTLGLPTSTTVSIVFELLGASVAIAIIKMINSDVDKQLMDYINTDKASQIILGIVLSVIIAFTIGAIVQFLSRVLLTFKFDKRPVYISAIFGGTAITSIVYFLLIKGMKGVSFLDKSFIESVHSSTLLIVIINFMIWTFLSFIFVQFFKQNIYKFIIAIGTFSLAMAFAGNDLVNFIGVPIAAWQSYDIWHISDIAADEFAMSALQSKVHTPTIFLLAAGLIMVATLWFSKKARNVVKTSLDLSAQDEIKERFKSNLLSRFIVRSNMFLFNIVGKMLPLRLKQEINDKFIKHKVSGFPKNKILDVPVFDAVRASVNLMVSGILISVATSMKLPLSTTYVTFMVAMGTSFSDRAWGADSAVYRVAGVLNVVGGWFLTAIVAFSVAAIFAYLIHMGGAAVISVLLLLVLLIFTRKFLKYNKELKDTKIEEHISKAESSTINEIIAESAHNISAVVHRSEKLYANVIEGLATKDLALLKKTKKGMNKLSEEISELQNGVFYFIRNLKEPTLEPSSFYILIIRHLQDLAKAVDNITRASFKHVDNNHKGITFKQIGDLKEVQFKTIELFDEIKVLFKDKDLSSIDSVIKTRDELSTLVNQNINKQIERTKNDESSPKNTALYFFILLETKDLIGAVMGLLTLYHKEYQRLQLMGAIPSNEK